MKRNITFAALAAALTCLVSCHKDAVPSDTPASEGYIKQFSLSLFNNAVKSSESASGESTIDEAAVFVYQTNRSTGTETLYKTVYANSGDIDVPLLFNDHIEFTYRFDAYVNMGELQQAPSEVRFSDETSDRFQMHGSLSGISRNDASQATVYLERYAARVVVNSVRLSWKQDSNASQAFTLKRIWLANTAELSEGAAAYNIGGTYTASSMEYFLMSEVNQVIANGTTYNIPHYLYAYGAEGSALVLECDWAGRTMYYHVNCPLQSNSSTIYNFIIHQTGSDEPLGEITDDALTSVGSLAASEWNSITSNNTFGEEKYPGAREIPAYSAMIFRTNNRFYTAAQWREMGLDKSEAVGVAISDGIHALVVHPDKGRAFWDSTTSGLTDFDGMSMHSSEAEAIQDFSGKSNTDALIAAYNAGFLKEASAARIARNTVFANGKKGYLPAAGELRLIRQNWGSEDSDNQNTFYHCMSAIGGATKVNYAWSSTLMSPTKCWYWDADSDSLNSISITTEMDFHIVCTL